ncbi:phospholipase A [Capnocytophaga bilenii]
MKKITLITLLLLSAESFSQQPAQDTILPSPEATDSKVSLDNRISKLWELDREDQRGTFRFLEYQPMYIMPFRFTDVPTEQPRSLNLNRPIPERRDLRLFVQATHGYADSLIDYNYKQTTIGVGFTFLNL